MNQDDVFEMFNDVRDKYVQEAIESRNAVPRRGVGPRRIFLMAAVIAMALLLVGCGIVYVLKMQNLKLGDQQVTQERWDKESGAMVSEMVSQQVLTFSGLKGTPNYEAAKEWYEFRKTYDPNWKIYHEQKDAGTLDYGPAEYSLYNCYTTEMWKKVEEIKDKYDLKLQGEKVEAFNAESLYAYLGMDGVILEGAKVETDDFNVAYYDGGWLHTDMHMTLTEEPDWPYRFLCSLYYNPKECFDATVCELNDTADWQEWNYTTASGDNVLVIRSPSVSFSWVFCDRGDATITLRIETIRDVHTDEHGYQEVIRTPMTDDQLRQVLECIDFSICPQPGDANLLEGPAASRELTQTSNGYTVTVKDVFTDGLTTKVTLGITAPEDMNLEQYLAHDTEGFLNFSSATLTPRNEVNALSGGGGHGAKADNDGKTNTVDYTVETSYDLEEGIVFPKGSVCRLSLQDLYVNSWNKTLSQWEVAWEMDGDWNFELTLDNGDWTEIEFVSDPITTNVCYGWDMDGNDVFRDETIASIKLRAFGADYISPDAEGQLDFANYRKEQFPKVVLKDGKEIKLGGDLMIYDPETDGSRIPMDKVDHLELIDGTKLYPADPAGRQEDFSLEVKSAVTDGKTAQVILGLTVPYWAEMCQENCGYSIAFGNFGDYTILMPRDRDLTSKKELMAKYAMGENLEAREDGDGRDDTVEIVYTMYVHSDSAYFMPGSSWLLHVEDMSAERMHYPEGVLTEIEQLWTASGVRNLEFTFTESSGPRPPA